VVIHRICAGCANRYRDGDECSEVELGSSDLLVDGCPHTHIMMDPVGEGVSPPRYWVLPSSENRNF